MRTFTKQELDKILDNHKLWLSSGGEKGERADLSFANLSSADLRYADLRYADLSFADLDFSAFPFWCGGLNINIDDKIAIQLLYHFVSNVKSSPYTSKQLKSLCNMKSIIKQANKFHRVGECGIIEED